MRLHTGSAQHKRALKRAHRGRRAGTQGAAKCTFFPTFLLFKLERWNLVSRFQHHSYSLVPTFLKFWWHMFISNSPWHTVISISLWHTVIFKTKLSFLKIHVPRSTEIGQKLRFDIFWKFKSTEIGQKRDLIFFLKIHVPASTKIGQKWSLRFF